MQDHLSFMVERENSLSVCYLPQPWKEVGWGLRLGRCSEGIPFEAIFIYLLLQQTWNWPEGPETWMAGKIIHNPMLAMNVTWMNCFKTTIALLEMFIYNTSGLIGMSGCMHMCTSVYSCICVSIHICMRTNIFVGWFFIYFQF